MFVLRWIGFVLRLALTPLLLPWVLLRRRLPRNAWLQVDIDGGVIEFPVLRRPLSFLSFGGPRSIALSAFHELIDDVAREPRVRGVVVVIRHLRGGMATATSLRQALVRLRQASARDVVVYLPNGGDTKELYVASAATRIIAGPRATLAPVGFVSSSRYAKRALDKLGVAADRLAVGTYKSAGETLERDSMSAPQREQLDALLDTFYGELVSAVASGRNVDEARAKALIDGAPYSSEHAVSNGLVDAVAYEDELPSVLGDVHLVSGDRFLAARRAHVLPRLRSRNVLAVLPLHGAITSGVGPLAADERFISSVRALRTSRRVRGGSCTSIPLAAERSRRTGCTTSSFSSPRRSPSSRTSATWQRAGVTTLRLQPTTSSPSPPPSPARLGWWPRASSSSRCSKSSAS